MSNASSIERHNLASLNIKLNLGYSGISALKSVNVQIYFYDIISKEKIFGFSYPFTNWIDK